ncbi:hypothetical protein [Marinimicrobium alkaliphilum]|uniref:hypothetical protein n=1 Tax=Marinimicrobium alkaliphilum TaxID=2202654 RepID=UPI000DBA0162|nr:hypothetical protein [Marinimicrobium alkaliphilum]
MPDILFPQQNIDINTLYPNDEDAIKAFLARHSGCSTLMANRPYCHQDPSPLDLAIVQRLQAIDAESRQHLVCAIDDFGEDIHTLAVFYERLIDGLNLNGTNTLVGAGATTRATRLDQFHRALISYRESLVALNNHRRVGRVAASQRRALEQAVRRDFQILQDQYQVELKKIGTRNHAGRNRGNALSSAERGVTLANRRRSRNLYVDDLPEAQRLQRLSQGIRYAGNGVVALDGVSRIHAVHRTHRAGGNWQREAAAQATGFGAGGAAGLAAGKGVVIALTKIGLAATPAGWVILLGAGITVGYFAATQADRSGTSFARRVFDR